MSQKVAEEKGRGRSKINIDYASSCNVLHYKFYFLSFILTLQYDNVLKALNINQIFIAIQATLNSSFDAGKEREK